MKAKRILLLFLCFALFVLSGDSIISAFFVKANAADALPTIATSDPLEDLKGATVAGQPFSLENFPASSDKASAVLSVAEFGYSYSSYTDYGFYIYIYNPQLHYFDLYPGEGSKIYIRLGADTSKEFSAYGLSFVSRSTDENARLFYKYKVNFTEEDLKELDASARIYNISKLELQKEESNGHYSLETIACGDVYTFSGYMAGYGSRDEATLSCKQDDSETIQLDVEFAYYRPEGTIAADKRTEQDCLYSVYFAVPKEYVQKYGRMTKMHAGYVEAILKPILVTGNKNAFNAFSRYKLSIQPGNSNVPYGYVSSYYYIFSTYPDSVGGPTTPTNYGGNWLLNVAKEESNYLAGYYVGGTQEVLEGCPLMFYSGDGVLAESYTVPGNTLKEEVLKMSKACFGNEKIDGSSVGVNGEYHSYLFSSYEPYKEITIDVYKDKFDLRDFHLSENFWKRIFGIKDNFSIEDIKAIHEVTTADFGEDAEASAKALYVSLGDYVNLSEYYTAHSSESVIYLVRFKSSVYTIEKATCVPVINGVADVARTIDDNAYFAQTDAILDFHVIDLTFTNDDKDTVIPVIMERESYFADITPPPEQDDNWEWLFALLKLLLFCFVVVVIVMLWSSVVSPILKLLFKGIVFVLNLILTPFRWIFKRKK